MSMRDTIHGAALQAGRTPALGTEIVDNTRIYQRDNRTLLVGYTPNGATTGLNELIETDSGYERGFEIAYRDKDKASQILAWLKKTAP